MAIKQYRPLYLGERIKAGDEFQRISGEWVAISAHTFLNWRTSTQLPLRCEQGDLPMRREIKEDRPEKETEKAWQNIKDYLLMCDKRYNAAKEAYDALVVLKSLIEKTEQTSKETK